MVKARKYVVVKHFEGLPKREDFEVVEYELPQLKSGDILVKSEWISVDPYQRAYNIRYPVPFDQFGFQVGLVEDSRNPLFPVGSRVVSHKGWCDYYVSDANVGEGINKVYKLPNGLKGLSNSLAVGAVGMTGITAYYGFLQICKPKAGDTVVVTGAAGAVGSVVGQIAKIKGCKVIGFTGSDDKVSYLEQLGFDKVFNYKTTSISDALKEAAPNGVDCFFDNVGGEMSTNILIKMNNFGRVSVCGSISAYNDDPNDMPKAGIVQPFVVGKQLKVEGFLVSRWTTQEWFQAFEELSAWVKSGQLKTPEHVTEGFNNIFDAFIGMLNGNNYGKAVVKL